MTNIDVTKIQTKEDRAAIAAQAKMDAVTAARAGEYQGEDGTDKALLEVLLKKFKDDPDVAPIWQRRLEIQAANPKPVGE